MIKNTPDQLILHSLSPNLLRNYIVFGDVDNLHLIKRDRHRSIEEIDIHIENVRKNGSDIIGYSSLKEFLEGSKDKKIYILSGYDKKYGFDLYLDESKSQVIGVAIIELRKKNEEELRWERDLLGIKHP